ncbi:ATP-binding protein [Porcipelethomonas ammoniilytica]|uniref:AAA family ATPase n=1 Tax=Porcipelethomonas ammoniilytica TaxID=2981722 RepID=UPI000820BCDD|nr:AAA family ATPase [Porcipelethomonas ammoniilytica]MCU6720575.1 ATP-binding protein [Porcipelethomonas ammoniilytica]SCJ17644.1 Predicted AAA-ATPase [uncultured Ruminococcus sp.]
MGIYLNPSNIDFQQALNSKIYVDKSMLIDYSNSVIYTEQKFICVSRPRRFGKSMAANMLTAYYSRGCDSGEMFSNLKISKADTFEKHLNRYNVIHINMVNFLERSKSIDDMLDYLGKRLIHEIKKENGDVDCFDWNDLISVLDEIFHEKKIPFIFIIDEWDCIFREHKNDTDAQTKYLDFLRSLLKDQSYVALAYMTGILPIKKYGKHSAINAFYEYSMTYADPISEFTGFTEEEVKLLCQKYDKPFEEMKRWYDGYNLNGISIYNPKSVVESILRGQFNNYWTSTETYEALKVYIEMNFDGLKDTIIELLAGQKSIIDTTTFSNDMVTFETKDDVLTLLVHLGYLTYDFYTKEVSIPNYEISEQFASTIKVMGWSEVANSLKLSDELLKSTLNGNEEKVAELIDKAHSDNTSILKYNDENSLSCVISLAYYSARKTYTIERELSAGKGFADLVFRPRKNNSNPAMIVELKYDKSADSALDQIKKRQYADCLKDYSGEVLLVGINYNKNDKRHTCKIKILFK